MDVLALFHLPGELLFKLFFYTVNVSFAFPGVEQWDQSGAGKEQYRCQRAK